MVHILGRKPIALFAPGVLQNETARLLRQRVRQLKNEWFPNATWRHHRRTDLFLNQVTDKELLGLLRGHGRSLITMMKHILAGTALYDVRMNRMRFVMGE